jgi:hypothetical protein
MSRSFWEKSFCIYVREVSQNFSPYKAVTFETTVDQCNNDPISLEAHAEKTVFEIRERSSDIFYNIG